MHTNTRLRTLGLLTLTAVAAMGSPLFADVTLRNQVKDELLSTIDIAASRYRSRLNSSSFEALQKEIIAQSQQRLEELSKKKHELRKQIVALRKSIAEKNKASDAARVKSMALQSKATDQRENVRTLVARVEAQQLLEQSGPEILRLILDGAQRQSLQKSVLQSLRESAFMEVSLNLAVQTEEKADAEELMMDAFHSAAGDMSAEEETLMGELSHAQADYLDQLSQVENAQHGVLLSQSQMQAVKNDIAEIHREVLRMQSTLARLDESARRKSERSLIEMGILDGRPGQYSPDQAVQDAKQIFRWPATGYVSAGFGDANYRRFFGFPHSGMDIVIPQETAVKSAADGVVFVVRDGGATGYTYILIGHQGGFATLYGHMSKTIVSPGQNVLAGEVIGLSGGRPGSPGAGPTTTAPHLHFEVIRGGVNINPMTVLP